MKMWMGMGRKIVFFYKVAKNLANLYSSVSWKLKIISDELGYLIQEISKQNTERIAKFLIVPYGNV